MINLRDVVMSSGGIQVGSRAPDVTDAEIAGVGVDLAQGIQQEKDTRDAAAFNAKAQTDLQIFGVEALERARTQSKTPEDITKNFLEIYEQRYNDIKAQSPNAVADKQLDDIYGQLRRSMGTTAMRTQVAETQNFRNQQSMQAYDTIANGLASGAYDYKTAKQLSGGVTKGLDSFNGPTQRMKMAKAQKENLAKVAVSLMSDNDKYSIFSRSRKKIPDHIDSVFQLASTEHGIPYSVMATIAQIESGMNPKAKNPNSSASGLFQFINGTAKEYGVNPMDPKSATEGFARLYKDNREILRKKLGRAPTNAEMYLAHQQGAGGAARLLSSPNALASDVVGDEAVKLNGGTEDMSAAEFAALWLEKYDAVEAFVGEGEAFDPNVDVFNDLSVSDKVSLMGSLKDYAENQSAVEAIRQGRGLYMDKKKAKPAADQLYKEEMAAIAPQLETSADLINASIGFVNSYNVVPTELKNTVAGMLKSQQSEELLLGSDFIVKVMENNPEVAEEFGEDAVNKAILVSNLNEQGVPFADIAQRIKVGQLARPEDVKAYSAAYDEVAKKVSDIKYIQNAQDPGLFSSAADVPLPMVNDFNREAKAMMPYFQDVKAARKAAYESIKRSWGVSNIGNEPRWVKGSPEQRFGAPGMTPEENSEWMRNQIMSQFTNSFWVEPDMDYNVRLTPSRTDANYYNVIVEDENGVITPMLWQPDWTKSKEAIELQKKIEKQIIGDRKEFLNNREKALTKDRGFRPIDWKVGRPFE